ncbi:MAG: hemolysin family protein [Planctomycetota bacterium]|jgi:putative hemolysin
MSWGEYLWDHWWRFVVLLGLLGCSGFFSGTETALFNLTRGQLYRLSQSKSRIARLVASMMGAPRRVLQTLLLGNMIVNVAYSAVAAILVLALNRRGLPAWATVAAAGLPVLVLILIGEVTPKMLAYRLRERWALLSAAPLEVISRLFSPVVRILERTTIAPLARLIAPRIAGGEEITPTELGAMLDLSARRGLIGRDAGALLQEIVQLTDIRVSEIMVPRVDVVAYDADHARAGLVELFHRTRLRKIPVYSGDIDHILGVVHAKHILLNPSATIRSLVTEVPFLPEAANIERALLQLRRVGKQMAIVVDEYGGVAGLVTLEDIIEQIVGDIEETRQVETVPPVQGLSDTEYILSGDLGIHEWVEAFRIDLSGRRISTIGGFVVSLLGRIPSVGDEANYRNLRFKVEAMRGRRISRLHLKLLEVTS